MASVAFTLNGKQYELSREDVTFRLLGVHPSPIHQHAVQVNGLWYPVKQAFEVAVGVPRSQFISHTARRHLGTLGFPLGDEVTAKETPAQPPAATPVQSEALLAPTPYHEEWHTETNVQAAVVTALAARGYKVLSVANTATKQHGIDIIATLNDQRVGVEVKGFPSKLYADPTKAGQQKNTSPSTQAAHWFAAAVLAAMRLRGREPAWRSVIALPDFSRYRDLADETRASLAAAGIIVWWVDEDGTVEMDEEPDSGWV